LLATDALHKKSSDFYRCASVAKLSVRIYRIIIVSQTVEVLILDLLEWLSLRNRSYEETMDAWRTSCPKLPIWEDANDRGLVTIERRDGRSEVRVTPAGWELLHNLRPERVESDKIVKNPIP